MIKVRIYSIISLMLFLSCSDFLDKKPNSRLAIPETLKDLRALLDNEDQIIRYAPALLEMGNDDIYVRPEVLKSRPEAEQLIYTWQRSELRSDIGSWTSPYKTIMMCNVVLEALDRGVDGSKVEKETIRGEALFVRAYAYLALSQIYCKPYDRETSEEELGLPLRLSSDFNLKIARSSLTETYSLIIDDLLHATVLLPESVSLPTRPSKAAAYAALARTYLYMNLFSEANLAAEEALKMKSNLIDYNSIERDKSFPFTVFHEEIIYYSFTANGLLLTAARAHIPKSLFDLYEDNDLRKKLFFNKSAAGDIIFKGYYNGTAASYFAGIATDELYLIRAECEARVGDITVGTQLLNALIEKRWAQGEFVAYVPTNRDKLLKDVLLERRKQFPRRGLRWSDLRRLNQESGLETKLVREFDFQGELEKYELLPRAIQYIYPIPRTIMLWDIYEQNLI
ncbi:RagB/SusD family nutrient uptake outer membrane protein [Sphingobacterium sp. UT-1RO-CII-1]|uniref:RagB/SusD family nutrient uptake outer membrane protein n=1 Tax=Sphingobacterium sp. UT-1RO-CII-1 TaxID=2995225 RepID=UPI00227D1491|nr:RagB/SusD family nutrient uptake outer membrane protein [Sphingobacterium sp. UT-1RO-CII-1]MCY4781541.1 RagB/SusD family nutrient uptake outer membrane protein [Sphingobacterium sp. UT-1RO-CII-1]